ncbi:MAG: hypothetical protein JF610_00080 [Acidobacteria bacterium]|nr:hypothetical protein [Acidobacteriota bacterium]
MPSLRPWRYAMFAACACFAATAGAHDFERTRVTLTFARDGSFVLDVTNDAAWLEHRLIPFRNSDPRGTPSFADRVVLFLDGREVRPQSVEMVANAPPLVTYRMRGRVPPTAHALRWYYGLPIDPYPLTIRRADGRIVVEEIAGDAWSRPIDLSGQFAAARVSGTTVGIGIAVLFAIPIAIKVRTLLLR